MKEFFGEIIKDLDRTEFGYAAIKQIAQASEHIQSAAFFEILLTTFRSLNDFAIPLELTRNWFELNLAAAIGEEINLEIDSAGEKLSPEKRYEFDNFDKVFVSRESGRFGADHIKFLRLMLASEPRILAKITGGGQILCEVSEIIAVVAGR